MFNRFFEINLCCPLCGEYVWETTETETCICSSCGHTCTPKEMEPHYFERDPDDQ